MNQAQNNTRLICPLTAHSLSGIRAELHDALALGAEIIEVRLDYLDTPPSAAQLAELLCGVDAEVIVTNRPVRQGGRCDDDETSRLDLLRQAAAGATYADLEFGTHTSDWPAGRVIVSHHRFDGPLLDAPAVLAAMGQTPAAIHKIAFRAEGPEHALAALDLLRDASHPTISLAMGEHGVASRILARKFGAFGTFAAIKRGHESAPGQPTLEEFRNLYRWAHISPATAVYGIIGCPLAHSMSPAIHNAAFEAMGMDAVYVPMRVEPGAAHFNRFMDELLKRPWLDVRGLSITIPHKENALAYVGAANCDELAVRIGAVNTITIGPDGSLRGDNTDYAAALDALCTTMLIRRKDLAGRKIAVLGAGGVARAIVAAARWYGADVTVLNRTPERAATLAADFDCHHEPWSHLDRLQAEIVINCTPIGMHPNIHVSPLAEIGPSVRVVFDTIYNPIETALLRQAIACGCQTISGVEMFVNQAVGQFEIWTGRTAPREEMRHVTIHRLTKHG